MNLFRNKKSCYLLLLFIAALFITLFSWVTTPFIDRHAGDSSIFMAMGKMFLDGMIPYVDFFDHKGPVIIVLEALGQFLVPYQTGVFIFQIIHLFLVLLVIYKALSFFLENIESFIVILLFLITLSFLYGMGNFTEEYSLLPLFISLYIGVKYYFKTNRIGALDGFVLGLCFSFLFWLRVNNAGFLCGVALFLFIATLMDRDVKSTWNLLLYFIVGQIPLSAIFFLYFFYHDAINEMLYATFIFNMSYLESVLNVLNRYWWVNILVLVLLVVGTWLRYRKEKNVKIIIFTGSVFLFSFLTINIGYAYKHYFILMTPAFVLGCALILSEIDKKEIVKNLFRIVVLTLVIVFTIQGIKLAKRSGKENANTLNYKESVNSLLSQIPNEENNRIYYYNVEPIFYTIMKLNTNYKYFILQEWHGSHDANIFHEINDMMRSDDRPYWVLMDKSSGAGYGVNAELQVILDEDYELYDQNQSFVLLKYAH